MGVDAKASAVLITMVVGFFAGRPSFDVKYASGRGARSVKPNGHHAAMPMPTCQPSCGSCATMMPRQSRIWPLIPDPVGRTDGRGARGQMEREPASRMKAGREHRVPLAPRCLDLLQQAKLLAAGNEFVFPGRSNDKAMSNMVWLMTMRRLKSPWSATAPTCASIARGLRRRAQRAI
jgi:hypothetical protein